MQNSNIQFRYCTSTHRCLIKIYRPSSSDSDSEIESTRVLRGSHSQMSITSQSSDIADLSPSPSPIPTCQKKLKAFNFSIPKHKRRYVVGNVQRKFHGNQNKVTKTHAIPDNKSPICSAASRKLKFESPVAREKREITIRTDKYDSLDVSVKDPIGNCIISFQALQSMFGELLCAQCSTANIRVLDSGTRSGCAHYILLNCKNCQWGKYFWTVSGKFFSKLQVGNQQIPKRNELVYSSVLAGRLIGVGLSKLSVYHAFLNLVSPLTWRVFTRIQNDIVKVADMVAIQSMERAREDLIAFHQSEPSDPYVSTVASFDGAYQMRSGKMGEGFSRYCFGAAIAVNIAIPYAI